MLLVRQERKEREAREPVFTHVIARDVGKSSSEVFVGSRLSDRTFFRWKSGRDASPAPRTAQIEPIQMSNLAVGPITDSRRLEQRRRLPIGNARQELREPVGKVLRLRPRHAEGFGEGR